MEYFIDHIGAGALGDGIKCVPLRHLSKKRRRVFDLEDDNARLRELCKKLYDFAWFEQPHDTELIFAEDMEELGIKTEV